MSLKVPRAAASVCALGLRDVVLMSEHPLEGPPPITVAGGGPRSAAPLSAADLLALMRDDPSRGAPLFYDRYQREVNRLVWRLLGADPEHDDVVQQVFLTALRRVSAVRDPDRLLSWVRTVTVNAVYDEVRKRRIRRLFLRDAAQDDVHPSLVRDVEVRDFVLHAKRVLDMMPAAERMVFLLHIVEGRGLVEIAELCRCSHATAKRRLARAHRRLDKLATRHPELLRLLGGERSTESGAAANQRGDDS
jgi:RNA polymerase sigma-70 factor (ECF subfamily)